MSNELEQLTDGVTSEFWRWFLAHKEREWGIGGQRYEQAVLTAASKQDAESVAFLRMVLFARTEIERLCAAPAERLNVLKHTRPDGVASASRRGPGL